MKEVPFFVVALLFGFKLLMNALMPIELVQRPRGPKGERPGVSLMPFVELFLLWVLLGLSGLGLAPYSFVTTLWVGGAAVVASYVLMFVVAAAVAAFCRVFSWEPRSARRDVHED